MTTATTTSATTLPVPQAAKPVPAPAPGVMPLSQRSLFRRAVSVVKAVLTVPPRSACETVEEVAGTVITPSDRTKLPSTGGVVLESEPALGVSSVHMQVHQFFLDRVAKNGVRIKVTLGAQQERLNTLWESLSGEMITQAKARWPDWLGDDVTTSSDLERITIDWKTGYAEITHGTELKPGSKTGERIPKTRGFLFVEDPASANNPYQEMWKIIQRLGVSEESEKPAEHTQGLDGAALGFGSEPFADPAVQKNKPRKASIAGFQQDYLPTIADPAVRRQTQKRLTLLSDILKKFKEKTKVQKDEVVAQISRTKTEAAAAKAEAERAAAAEASARATKVPTEALKAQLGAAEAKAKQAEAAVPTEEAKLKELENFEKQLANVDEFALGWVLEHPYQGDDETLPPEKRVERVAQWVDSQVKALIAHFKYIGFYNWENYGKSWYRPGTSQARQGIELYFRNIALLGLGGELHALVCQKLGIQEPECNLGREILLYVQTHASEMSDDAKDLLAPKIEHMHNSFTARLHNRAEIVDKAYGEAMTEFKKPDPAPAAADPLAHPVRGFFQHS